MTLYTSATAQHFDGEYIIATLMNQAFDKRKAAQVSSSEIESERLRGEAQELEAAAALLDLAGDKIADAYQIIGALSNAAGVFGDPGVQRALDYMSDNLDVLDKEHVFSIEQPTIRIRTTKWMRSRWYRIRRGLGHRYDWERELEAEDS